MESPARAGYIKVRIKPSFFFGDLIPSGCMGLN
jgi:hypothetical protein